MSNKLEMMFTPWKKKFEASQSDIEAAKKFLLTNKWGAEGCPFHLEWPYIDMPSMLKDKITKHYLNINE